jgi:hypothetical protein
VLDKQTIREAIQDIFPLIKCPRVVELADMFSVCHAKFPLFTLVTVGQIAKHLVDRQVAKTGRHETLQR